MITIMDKSYGQQNVDRSTGHMFDEFSRLSTFSNWPVDSTISPGDLASAGLYYIGPGDKVICAFCKLKLYNFQPGEVPMEEHRRHNPSCPFLQKNSTKASIKLFSVMRAKSTPEPQLCDDSSRARHRSSSVDSATGPSNPMEPKYPAYNKQARLQSFENWPTNMQQTPEQLAEAGFFYTGECDYVRCFFCGYGLRGWEPTDNPWDEHEKWFPDCLFLKQSLEDRRQNRKPYSKKQPPASFAVQRGPSAPPMPTPYVPSSPQLQNRQIQHQVSTYSSSEYPSDLESQQEIERLKEEKLCKICMERERCVTFVPCGHLVCCSDCGIKCRDCPICRARIQETVRTFLA